MYLGKIAAGQSEWEGDVSDLDKDPTNWYKTQKIDKSRSKPFLFDFVPTFDLRDDKMSVKIADSTWSKGFPLSGEGTSGVIEITGD